MGQLTAATASISARSSTRSCDLGGMQMQSASAIIPRFVFSSLLSLVFKVISLLQSFQPLLKLSNLEGPEQRHPEIAECTGELGIHPPGPNISHRFGQHPLYIASRFGHRDMWQRRFVGVPITSASFLAKRCGFLGVGMKEAEPPLCGLALQGLPLDVVALQCTNGSFERLSGIGIPFPLARSPNFNVGSPRWQ